MNQGRVLFLKGSASIVRQGNRISVTEKSVILEKDIIQTDKKTTLVIELEHGKKIKVKAETKFQIQNLNRQGLYKLKLYRGGLFAKVNRLTKKEKFQIETVTTLAGVRGTLFYVHTLKNKSVWLCVNEGKVEVKEVQSKSKTLVTKGKGVNVESNKTIQAPKVFKWTEKLNWKMNNSEGNIEDKVNLEVIHKRWMKKKNN